MAFVLDDKVRFKHCDPAGIVFFPRYFEMMNDCVEAFFDALGFPFEALHRDGLGGVPTVRNDAAFRAPSRHGDRLRFSLSLQKLGRTSADLKIVTRAGDEIRMIYRATIVLVGSDVRPRPWPEEMRRALEPYLKEADL